MKEANLGNPQNTIKILQKYNFNFQKRLGQNFLIDNHVISKIIKEAGIESEDCVLEVGPGIGTLTGHLALAAKKVIAVEIDKNLIPILKETLADFDNIKVINEDILKLDIEYLVKEENKGEPIRVIANLPYYITTPIIMGLLEGQVPIKSMTVMVQKEVASRIASGPGSKNYGALSLAVQYYAKPYLVANVPPNSFIPRPKVGSAVIHLEKYLVSPIKVKEERLMFQLIRAAFNQRRKTLVNGIYNFEGFNYSKEEVEGAVERLGKGKSVRGETLTLEEFGRLADELEGL
jgi:16S rRNA (adenine1518-N6/adenine1519-N6)-dimethyltransferase